MEDTQIQLDIYDATNEKFTFTTLHSLIRFFEEELECYESKRDAAYFIDSSYAALEQILLDINEIVSGFYNDIQNYLSNSFISLIKSGWIYSKSSLFIKGMELDEERSVVNAFFLFAQNKYMPQISEPSGLKGALLAFEILTPSSSKEETYLESMLKIREQILSERDSLFSDLREFKEQKFSEINKSYDDFKVWDSSSRNQFDSFMDDRSKKIDSLQNTYHEILRLQKPAEYWKKKAVECKKQGQRWMVVLSVIIIFGLAGFSLLLNTWLKSGIPVSEQIGTSTFQGLALFVTILSIYAFALRATSKLTFSSFHLQRDAEEREQLTHVYLALTNENETFDKEARMIILQALFSRADTGLIAGDSSPTMPGLHEILKAAK